MAVPAVCPKLLLDVVFLPTADGVLFKHRGSVFLLRGRGMYALVSSLVPHLNGNLSVEQLCADLDDSKRISVGKLLDVLIARRLVIDHLSEGPILPEAVLHAFQAQLEYIEHCADHPLARFRNFRQRKIVLTGSGVPLRSSALSLLRNGLETVTVEAGVIDWACDDELSQELARLHTSGVAASIKRESMDSVFAGADQTDPIVCYVSAGPNLHEVLSLSERCTRLGVPFLPGILLAGKAVVGPFASGQTRGCFECALLRWTENLDAELSANIWRSIALKQTWQRDAQPASRPALRILGNLVGFELFRYAASHLNADSRQALLLLDLTTLETKRSSFLAHPLCSPCSKPNSRTLEERAHFSLPVAERAPALSLGERLKRVAPLVSADCGIIQGFEDDSLDQLPLFRSTVKAAFLGRDGGSINSRPAYDLEANAQARVTALMDALSFYAQDTADSRSTTMATVHAALHGGDNPIEPQRLVGWLGSGCFGSSEAVPWVVSHSLTDGSRRMVPAAAVFVKSHNNLGFYEDMDAGVGVGFAMQEAVSKAILSLLIPYTLKRAASAEIEFAVADLTSWAASSLDIAYLCKSLRAANQDPVVLLIGNEYAAVALAHTSTLRADPHKVSVIASTRPEEAIVEALTELLALSIGGESRHTMERYLPSRLGYGLTLPCVCGLEILPYCQASGSLDPERMMHAFGPGIAEVVIANITPTDLEQSGFAVVKAMGVTH